MLSQAEIDALLSGSNLDDNEGRTEPEAALDLRPDDSSPPGGGSGGLLEDSEKDALGEIGNICMGAASTTLSELLRQKVVITSPRVEVIPERALFESFKVPYVVIQVEFKAGLTGYNVLVIKLRDAMIMANLMMGGDGEVTSGEISELELSAASEAMNQMIGSASTSLSTMFGRAINISPPVTKVLENPDNPDINLSGDEESVVAVSFDMKIGDLVDTEIMQVLSIATAKKEAALLWESIEGASPPEDEPLQAGEEAGEDEDNWLSKDFWPGDQEGGRPEQAPEAGKPAAEQWKGPELKPAPRERFSKIPAGVQISGLTPEEKRKLELLLEVPLKVSVVLGRTRRPIREVLNLTPGAIVELNSLVDEPVEVLVNGTLVAKGEVVVVNENFGVRITYIMSPEERLRQLKE
ncbi:MAG: flagellar motor switch phosphatase FliY [Peptococcaceae bacterium]|nr:flagellar motor switch phosphatase FliY [Peptococcaceae bacterium]